MYHLMAYSQDVATGTLTDLTPVADGIIPIQNGHFLPGLDLRALWSVAYGTNLQRAYFDTPTLRQIARVYIRPIQPSLVGAGNPNVANYLSSTLQFRGEEEISCQAIHNAGVNQRITVLVAAGPNPTAVPPGQVTVTRYTSTTAAVANAWTQIAYTLDTALPAGSYAVLLAEHQSANAQAVRLTFDNQFLRPGFPGLTALSQRLPDWFYRYPHGTVGTFRTYSLPRIEVLCNGADASHEGYLHLVRVG